MQGIGYFPRLGNHLGARLDEGFGTYPAMWLGRDGDLQRRLKAALLLPGVLYLFSAGAFENSCGMALLD